MLLARAWRISPADVRRCTLREVRAMRALLDWEADRHQS